MAKNNPSFKGIADIRCSVNIITQTTVDEMRLRLYCEDNELFSLTNKREIKLDKYCPIEYSLITRNTVTFYSYVTINSTMRNSSQF